MLGGMAALPGTHWAEERHPAGAATIGTVHHVFTHFALDLDVVRVSAPVGEGWWQPLTQLSAAGLPTLYNRAAEIALAGGVDARAAA